MKLHGTPSFTQHVEVTDAAPLPDGTEQKVVRFYSTVHPPHAKVAEPRLQFQLLLKPCKLRELGLWLAGKS